ncbi:hypothetical protein D3C71_1958060 [compost metagenome]
MDKRLKALTEQMIKDGAPGGLLNAVMAAKRYSGVLHAIVKAGGFSQLARDVGVTYQAVQQWHSQGYVPLTRVTELEALYGVPRTELMNPKYAAALADPSFSSDV